MPINWNLNASSLMTIVRHNFREIGKLMNETKSFTISATRYESTYVGDFNQHYDLLHIPNIGGYKFPIQAALNCKNIIIGLSGIDEIIYKKEVLVWKESWRVIKPLIDESVEQWKKYINKIKSIYVPTKSELTEMNQYLSIPVEKMTVINHGVDHDFFCPPNNKEQIRKQILTELLIPNQKFFLHVGENNFIRKNQQRITQAFVQAKKFGLQYNLIIVGKYIPKIEKRLSKIPGIFFLGWVTDEQLLKLFQSTEAFLMPSIHEGFGMPIVEAMACGTPTISSNIHAPPEIISNAGILVDPYSTQQILDALLKIAGNKNDLDTMSAKCLKRAASFSWKKNAKEIYELYELDTLKPMDNFKSNYERAAYRTLVTVCDLFPHEKQDFLNSVLRFNYSQLIEWAIEYGLNDPLTKDFLIPFEKWLYEKSNNKSGI